MKDINLSEEERAILLVDLKCRVIKAAIRIKSVKGMEMFSEWSRRACFTLR